MRVTSSQYGDVAIACQACHLAWPMCLRHEGRWLGHQNQPFGRRFLVFTEKERPKQLPQSNPLAEDSLCSLGQKAQNRCLKATLWPKISLCQLTQKAQKGASKSIAFHHGIRMQPTADISCCSGQGHRVIYRRTRSNLESHQRWVSTGCPQSCIQGP